ncbi:universal stress protein [Propioniciclava flava]|uniref:UspA domain-containing protein n=1 Tax=Propioniciclava flava TaxID=2072026 RepID=A0A4Q2EM17_9ACTN|nr:universal stress protein [Propioniciclava flava]RXW33664.1 hypothetical protein C1706_02685 [Propioniciclava flava]
MTISFDATGAIVVGTDLSDRATRAVDWAAERAAGLHRRLIVVLALPEVPIPSRSRLFEAMGRGDYPEHLRTQAQERLQAVADRVHSQHPDLTVETVLDKGLASYVLAQSSKVADLVVVGARGANAPVKVRALGGTADAVVAYGHGPIAVVTDHGAPTVGGPVVVGLDDSPEAEAALRIAVTEALRLEVPVKAVHAWDLTPWMVGPMGVSSLMALPDTEKLAARIDDIVAPYREQYPALTITVDVVEARPSAALVEASEGASLVVVGSRGLGGFTGLLLGSTSKEVLRDAACPVIVTRAPAQA